MSKELSNIQTIKMRERLKARRIFLELTYQELADKTRMSKSTLQRYETGGIKNLSITNALTLSKALGVSTDYFLGLTDDYINPKGDVNLHDKNDLDIEKSEQEKAFEENTIIQIIPKLIQRGYAVEKHQKGSLGTILATKKNEFWHIDLSYIVHKETDIFDGQVIQEYFLRLGKLVTHNKPVTKYSIATNEENIWIDVLNKYKPNHTNVKISLVVIKENGFNEVCF